MRGFVAEPLLVVCQSTPAVRAGRKAADVGMMSKALSKFIQFFPSQLGMLVCGHQLLYDAFVLGKYVMDVRR